MSSGRRAAFAFFATVAAIVIGCASFTTYHALSRTATVTVCGRSYQVAAGGTLAVAVGGASCRDVKVTQGKP